MRIKGETTDEMCGFLDATQQRLMKIQTCPTQASCTTIVIPSYNGARKLPGLTPLLALLLAREGIPVVIHGTPTEDKRIFTSEVLANLGIPAHRTLEPPTSGQVAFYPTALFHPGLQRLLEVRRVLNLRNPAHSLVKLLQPCVGPQVLVTSYTHPEYALAMEQVLVAMQSTAMLIRGTEGEAVADPRRLPSMRCIVKGQTDLALDHQGGVLTSLPDLPSHDAQSTATYIQAVLNEVLPVPHPIALQVAQILRMVNAQ
jgi:anthranilate phosphoribosyltransferase